MTTELTKAAQQALEALLTLKKAFFKKASTPEEVAAGCDKGYEDFEAGWVDPAHAAIAALERALTQRPAAQEVDERAAFEAWATSLGYNTERDMFQRDMYQSTLTWELWRVWQARASLTAPQQATPDHFPDVRNMVQDAPERPDFDAWWSSDGPNTASPYDAAKSGWDAAMAQQATPEPVGEPAAWQERQTEYVSGTFGRWYNCTGPSPRAAMEDGHLSLTNGGITYQWRPLYTRPAAAPAVPEGFTLHELQELERAVEDFIDCGETDVDDKLLMRGVQAGFLECTNYSVVDREALQSALAAAQAKGADHG